MAEAFFELIPTVDDNAASTKEAAEITVKSTDTAVEGGENDPFYYPQALMLTDPDAGSRIKTLQATLAFESFSTYLQDFRDFMADLNLRYFTADEFLYLGGSHHGSGSCGGQNSLPPRALWPNIRATATAIDEIRDRLGAPVILTSAYRNLAYNSCIGGATHSRHKQFDAVDWYCQDGRGSNHWTSVAKAARDDGVFNGWIGTYSTFVHIDNRWG